MVTRVLKGTSSLISVTFTVDETATDGAPDSATVVILNADGTELVSSTAAGEGGTGRYTFTLTPVHTANLNVLTANWTATINGAAQTVSTSVEVVGGFLFSLAELRAMSGLEDTVKYPTAALATARTLAESALEDACGVAFVPRYHRATIRYTSGDLALQHPMVRSVRAVTSEGTVWTQDQLDELVIENSSFIYGPSGWTTTRGGLTVAYEHGYDQPPPRVSRAAKTLARHYLIESPIDSRWTSISSEDGTFSVVTAGERGNLFDLPEVNAVVQEYGGYRYTIV